MPRGYRRIQDYEREIIELRVQEKQDEKIVRKSDSV